MALPAFMYGDPADVVERKETQSCEGCRHNREETLWGKTVGYCAKNSKRYGKGCEKKEAVKHG